ncbi:exosome complex component rrp45-like [Amphibalanus amphitrite]|uniref:exosome complex component rrp45-like n=1 Tax=Amphibalanus amphitrite TaxID=1232801 RepID=UPI001C8FDD37|nr:exosome complex component rrp45-like [Amphibalanus amphitrite]
MKPLVPSTCETNSVVDAVSKGTRLDGRELLDHREATIQFGREYGTCQIRLGNTRALATVRAELGTPRPSRPNEGTLQVAVDVTPTAAPGADRSNDLTVGLERLLERCLRESRCVDQESLCVVADEKVWQLRLHVELLDLGGNACDAAALAALAALCHFRRPHVSVTGGEVRLCPADEAEPVPLAVLHKPVLVTFAFFGDGQHFVADPTEIEERASEGLLTVGMNSYREICTLHLTGKLLLSKQQVLECTELAAARARSLTSQLRRALTADEAERTALHPFPGLARVELERIATAAASVRLSGAVRGPALTAQQISEMEKEVDEKLSVFRHKDMAAAAEIGQGGASQWGPPSDDEGDQDEMWPRTAETPAKTAPAASDSDSEGEQTVLHPEDLEPHAEPGTGKGLRCPMPVR